jgi:3'-phosphoadenosine 5'-phosphosulfate sulfotransferase (PAPS reductase)/FAD synthetase
MSSSGDHGGRGAKASAGGGVAPVRMRQPSLFANGRELDEPAVDAAVLDAARAGAQFVFNLSGGKDSTATSFAAIRLLDRLGHPCDRRLAVHADLGRAEWRSTPATVERCAQALGLPLVVVRRAAGDLVERWEVRFANAKARYEQLATYNLIGPWSQANKRFCTSELKTQVIGPVLARRFRGQLIVQVLGIRREESPGRAKTPISKVSSRFAEPGNRHGTRMMVWHPGVDWAEDEVFSCHRRHGLPLHEAYSAYGSTRLSCAFCVLASIRDLRAASAAAGNVDLYRHLVDMEAVSTFSFQPAVWLADVAPSLLSHGLAADVERAKQDAEERRRIEAGMPPGLRYVKNWPPRAPSADEAEAIAAARRPILRRHGLEDRFPTGRDVRRRFDELLAMKAAA